MQRKRWFSLTSLQSSTLRTDCLTLVAGRLAPWQFSFPVHLVVYYFSVSVFVTLPSVSASAGMSALFLGSLVSALLPAPALLLWDPRRSPVSFSLISSHSVRSICVWNLTLDLSRVIHLLQRPTELAIYRIPFIIVLLITLQVVLALALSSESYLLMAVFLTMSKSGVHNVCGFIL